MKFKKIYIEITNICNKNCSFCSKDTKPKKEMDINEFEHVLKEIKPFTKYIYLHIKGEPLIHSKINGILNLCKKYNIIVNITTNGTLLKENIKTIVNSDIIRQINVSINSYEKENEKDREYIDDLIYATKEILNKSNIIINYRFWALEKNNMSDINKKVLEKIISDLNIKIDYEELEKEKNVKLSERLFLSKASTFIWPSMENEYINDRGFCYGLKTHIGILSDGTVIPCCLDSCGVINLGNIFKKSLKEILNEEKTKKMIENFKNNKIIEPLCQRCVYRVNIKEMM